MQQSTELSYIINELAEDRELYFNAIAPPIVQTSNFQFKTVAALRKAFEDEMGGYVYSRGLNPTVDILRKKLAALDGAEDCLVFNNGAAAIFAAVFTNVKSGDHIIAHCGCGNQTSSSRGDDAGGDRHYKLTFHIEFLPTPDHNYYNSKPP